MSRESEFSRNPQNCREHIAERQLTSPDAASAVRAFKGATVASASLYGNQTAACVDQRLFDIQRREPFAPNAEQLAVLKAVVERVKTEMREERSKDPCTSRARTTNEPMLDMVHGLPVTGKSEVITWICEFFVDVLGWTRGNQFVCLAVQNAMASAIKGQTIHHWSGIDPFGEEGRGTIDAKKLPEKCLSLRFYFD